MRKVQKLMHALAGAGHASFIVGGAVRDIKLGTAPDDVDITTFATPEQVAQVAERCGWKTTGVGTQFGVTVVVIGNTPYEVATARNEWYGQDSHRPSGVAYTQDIREDLARRDFTINAMAITMANTIVDPFGGQQDIRNRVIRCVGNPADRFAEDALRPFRAVRFAAQLGFRIADSTLSAIPDSLDRVSGLSVERVRNEIEKILVSPHAARGLSLLVQTGLVDTNCRRKDNGSTRQVSVLPELMHLVGLPQNTRYHCFDAWDHTLGVVGGTFPNLTLRWAALLHDIAKGMPGVRGLNKHGEISDHGHDVVGADMARDILTRLKVHPAIVDRVTWLVRNHMTLPAPMRKNVLRWLKKQSRQFRSRRSLIGAVQQLLALRRADLGGGRTNPDFAGLDKLVAIVNDVLHNTPFYVSDLEISGKPIAQALGSGPQVGSFLANLLNRVQAGQLKNSTHALHVALQKKWLRLQP